MSIIFVHVLYVGERKLELRGSVNGCPCAGVGKCEATDLFTIDNKTPLTVYKKMSV